MLVNSAQAWYRVLLDLLENEGLPPVPEAEFLASFGQSSAEDARRFFRARVTVESLDASYDAAFPTYAKHVRPTEEGIPGLIAELRERRVRTAITTNAPGATSGAMLASTGLVNAVERVFTPDDVEHPKPAPDMVLAAMRHLGATPAETLLVGDSANDFGAARAAGITSIGYLTDGGDRRVETLRELLSLTVA